jgi:chitodextrinase
MYNRNKFFIGLTLLSLILVQSACGKAGGGGTSSATPSPTKVETYKVGDVVQVQDHTITLNKVVYYNGGRQADFTIENKGTEGVYVQPSLFKAQDGEGRNLQVDLNCGLSVLVGQMILPGHILKGSICWYGATVYPVNKIYYDAELYGSDKGEFGSNAVAWEVSGRPGSAIPFKKDETYKVGDVVQVQDHTITLSSVLFYNNGLQTSLIANFVIENKGSNTLYVKSDLFGATDNTDGSPLKKEPGCDFAGEVLPGHILQGSLCWNGITTYPVRLYSNATLYKSANDAPSSAIDDSVFWEFDLSSATPASTKVETYNVGDVIQLQDHVTITLDSVEFSNDGLQADFTIENKGSENFFADGSFGGYVCGSALEGTVLPGHTLKGNYCLSDITQYGSSYPVQVNYYLYPDDFHNPVNVIWVINK